MVFKLLRNSFLLLLIVLSNPLLANVMPSPAMMEQFMLLPRAEQERLAQQYGFDLNQLNQQSKRQASVLSREQGIPLQPRQLELQDPLSEKASKDEPKRFGLNMFHHEVSTFVPTGVIPVPDSYRLGPEDVIHLHLFGKQFREHSLTIQRDGSLNIPELGSMQVAGLSFAEARQLIIDRVEQSMIGVTVAVSMGQLRTINIFIAGEAKFPGTYTVSALTTVTQALFVAGGVSDIGALRDIRVKRAGQLISSFDLYDLLLKGDASNDIHLHNNDVLFVAPVQALAEVQGEVRRPAIFEVKSGDTLADLLVMAGGIKEGGYPRSAVVERFNEQHLRQMINVDLTQESDQRRLAQAGDILRVAATSPRKEHSVTLLGAAVRPGVYAWQPGMRILDLIGSIWSDVHFSTDMDYALVLREKNVHGDIEVHQFHLASIYEDPSSIHNLSLEPRDRVLLFHRENYAYQRASLNSFFRTKLQDRFDVDNELRWLETEQLANRAFSLVLESEQTGPRRQQDRMLFRDEMEQYAEKQQEQLAQEQKDALQEMMHQFLQDLLHSPELARYSQHLNRTETLYAVLQQLRTQARNGIAPGIISISGEVKVAGQYPLPAQATVQQLIFAAGGLSESAFLHRAELTRVLGVEDGQGYRVNHIPINLISELKGEQVSRLQSRDRLNVFASPNWHTNKTIEVRGEVRFPGVYTIQQGETLSHILQRAGGLTQNAFAAGAVFTREHLRERESKQLSNMVAQLRTEVATRSLSVERSTASPQDIFSMLSQIEMQQTVGRLVVNLPYILAEDPTADLIVEDGDALYIPRMDTSISIMGEVQYSSTHRFDSALTVDDYLRLAGGTRQRADRSRVYVIRADGSVMMPSNRMFRGRSEALQPGDTIVVPLDTEYRNSLSVWAQVTQIFYQSAVALAAISRI